MQTDWKIDVAMVESMGDHCIMVCTPWGLTQLQDGIQYVILVRIAQLVEQWTIM